MSTEIFTIKKKKADGTFEKRYPRTVSSAVYTEDGGSVEATLKTIAPAYDPTKTYLKDDVVRKNGKLYQSKAAISTAEAWNASHWTEISLEIAKKVCDIASDVSLLKTGKQDTLQSGTNIKTINGNSILGEGNITIEGGGSSVVVDSAMSGTSENPVQNKVVKAYIDEGITSASASAQASATSASNAEAKLTALQTAIQNLPDGQAVSAQVAENTEDIEDIKKKTTFVDNCYKEEGNESFTICDANGKAVFVANQQGVFFKKVTPKEQSIHRVNLLHPKFQNIGSDYSHILIYGQSLSIGYNSYITSDLSHTYTDNKCKMIGNAVFDGNMNTGRINADTRTLNPLTLPKSYCNPVSSATLSFANLYHRFVDKEQAFIASAIGVGGMSVYALSKGVDEYSFYDTNVLGTLTKMKAIADAENKTVSCPVIIWMQGEQDTRQGDTADTNVPSESNKFSCCGDIALYKQRVKKLKEDMQADIMEQYGQEHPPLFLVYQRRQTYTQSAFHKLDMNMALVELADENDDIILLNGMDGTFNSPDNSHLYGDSSYRYGEYIASIMYGLFIKNKHTEAVRPKSFSYSGNKIYVEFNSESPLVQCGNFNDGINILKLENESVGLYEDTPSYERILSSVRLYGNIAEFTCTENIVNDTPYLISFGGYGCLSYPEIKDSSNMMGMFKWLQDEDVRKGEYFTLDNKVVRYQKIVKF